MLFLEIKYYQNPIARSFYSVTKCCINAKFNVGSFEFTEEKARGSALFLERTANNQ